jgi:hypothetical protein
VRNKNNTHLKKNLRAGGEAQAVQCMPSKCEASVQTPVLSPLQSENKENSLLGIYIIDHLAILSLFLVFLFLREHFTM